MIQATSKAVGGGTAVPRTEHCLDNRHNTNNIFRRLLFIATIAGLGGGPISAGLAAENESSASVLIEEILVTARKRAQAESAQDVPVSITAFNEDQLKVQGFTNLEDISFSVPNVSLDPVGTTRGVSSFSIRGLSSTSSIITIDPAVATFIDGIYMPASHGSTLDGFDLESVQVLRGPQGTLFGRNVTGGAVLIRSKRPSQERETEVLTRLEGGGEEAAYTLGFATQGGLTDTISGRIALFYNDEGGYFENRALEADPTLDVPDALGDNRTRLVRGSLLFEPSDTVSYWLKYERLENDGDGVPSQNQNTFYGRNNGDLSNNYVAGAGYDVDFIVGELNWDVGPGTVTNITGWRQQESTSSSDLDSTRFSVLQTSNVYEVDMFSNELRYSGTTDSGKLDYTVGFFYFESELGAAEQTDIVPFG